MQYLMASEEILKVHSANMWIRRRLMIGKATLAFAICVGWRFPRLPASLAFLKEMHLRSKDKMALTQLADKIKDVPQRG